MGRPSNTETRRREIVEGLRKVMAREGYDGATIAGVAREAGLTSGLVHYHFSNKLEILLALITQLATDQDTALSAALASAEGDPVRELAAFIDLHLATGKSSDPAALASWVTISAEAIRSTEVREAYQAALHDRAALLEALIRRGVSAGKFHTRSPKEASSAILATIQGYFVLAATARDLIPRGSAARATRLMIQGLLGFELPPPARKRSRR